MLLGVLWTRPAVSCSSERGSSIRTPSVRCWFRAGAWTDPPSAEAILDSMALGRIDYYVAQAGGLAG